MRLLKLTHDHFGSKERSVEGALAIFKVTDHQFKDDNVDPRTRFQKKDATFWKIFKHSEKAQPCSKGEVLRVKNSPRMEIKGEHPCHENSIITQK